MREYRKEEFKRLEMREYAQQEMLQGEDPKFFRDAFRRFKRRLLRHSDLVIDQTLY